MRILLRRLFGLTLGLGLLLTGCSGADENGSTPPEGPASSGSVSSGQDAPPASDLPQSNAELATPQVVGQVANDYHRPVNPRR